MRKLILSAVATTAVLLMASAANAASIAINFDEFTSPPVTCCFSDTGVTGPLAYPDVTIQDALGQGWVMNSTGWSDMQTSGENLYGTTNSGMNLSFNSGVSDLFLDIINGTGADAFTLTFFNQLHMPIFVQVLPLNEFETSGSVARFGTNISNIWSAEIQGNSDFAIDTINFETGAVTAVPEPASLLLVGSGLAGLARRYRRRA